MFKARFTFCKALGLSSLLCALSFLAGCASMVSSEAEQKLGDDAARDIEQQMGFLPESELTAYIEELGRRLAAHSPKQDVEYKFYLVDMQEPNAFALPGGHVYVSRGLLALVNSEDELAGVIGHEIGHIAARHSVKRATRAAPLGILTGIASGLTGLLSSSLGDFTASVGGFANSLIVSPYSRNQEHEADAIGQKIAAEAGWDPIGISHFLHTLGREEELMNDGDAARTSFLATHPSTPARVRDTEKRAEDLPRGSAQPIAGTRPELLALVEGLVFGANPAQGVFEEALFVHPDLDFSLRFPEGWQSYNAPHAVAGWSPQQDAMVAIQMSGPGEDPEATALAFFAEAQVSPPPPLEKFRTEGADAVRIAVQIEKNGAELAWIAHEGFIYLVSGVSPLKSFDAYRPTFQQVAMSFRPPTPAELARIDVQRLRLISAKSGDSTVSLPARTGSSLPPEHLAIMNGIQLDVPLSAGFLLKIPLSETYAPRR